MRLRRARTTPLSLHMSSVQQAVTVGEGCFVKDGNTTEIDSCEATEGRYRPDAHNAVETRERRAAPSRTGMTRTVHGLGPGRRREVLGHHSGARTTAEPWAPVCAGKSR